jgi:hypothetical protein
MVKDFPWGTSAGMATLRRVPRSGAMREAGRIAWTGFNPSASRLCDSVGRGVRNDTPSISEADDWKKGCKVTALWMLMGVAFVGFCAYEASMRILDATDNFVATVGRTKYLIYFIAYGTFSAVLGGAAAYLASGLSYQITIAAVGGYSVPAGGRIMMAALVQSFFAMLRTMLGADPRGAPPSGGDDGNGTKKATKKAGQRSSTAERVQVEETWNANPPSSPPHLPRWLQEIATVMRLPVR